MEVLTRAVLEPLKSSVAHSYCLAFGSTSALLLPVDPDTYSLCIRITWCCTAIAHLLWFFPRTDYETSGVIIFITVHKLSKTNSTFISFPFASRCWYPNIKARRAVYTTALSTLTCYSCGTHLARCVFPRMLVAKRAEPLHIIKLFLRFAGLPITTNTSPRSVAVVLIVMVLADHPVTTHTDYYKKLKWTNPFRS